MVASPCFKPVMESTHSSWVLIPGPPISSTVFTYPTLLSFSTYLHILTVPATLPFSVWTSHDLHVIHSPTFSFVFLHRFTWKQSAKGHNWDKVEHASSLSDLSFLLVSLLPIYVDHSLSPLIPMSTTCGFLHVHTIIKYMQIVFTGKHTPAPTHMPIPRLGWSSG